MNLAEARVLLTGAAGGIGSALAAALLGRGAAVLLADLDETALRRLATGALAAHGDRVAIAPVNLASPAGLEGLADRARHWQGGINVLVNNAGVNHFGLLAEQDARTVELAVTVNVLAPLQLTRLLLPHLLAQSGARILNTGSVFGGIGYPGYAVYSATKFAMRGFSEALRRELAGTAVKVHYLAPRATRTGINGPAVEAMNRELKVAMDAPADVAEAACRLLERERAEAVVGWPEKLFVRLNGVLPRLVDRALAGQLPIIRRHARLARSPAATGALPGTRTDAVPGDAAPSNRVNVRSRT